MANRNFNKVNLRMRVVSQTKCEKSIRFNCAFNERVKEGEDAKKGASMFFTVYANNETEWAKADLTKKLVDVEGGFAISSWESGEKSGINYTIFADKITEVVWNN